MADIEAVPRIVQLNGGRLVGKTRLQKSAYFLESLGVGFDLDFEYHHYGPYSEELARLADDARALGLLDVDWGRTADGDEYAIYRSAVRQHFAENHRTDDPRRDVLRLLSEYSAIELELAATADFLEKNGYGSEAWKETRRRKASKISEERVIRAKQLLDRLRR
jgi:uncharacterized protein YwgA